MNIGTSRIQVNIGNVLKILADKYPTLHDMLLEYIQNPIDANAKLIEIVVNYKTRNIIITDNGDGSTVDSFEEALMQICHSQKLDTTEKRFGKFGIGLVSAYGKCKYFTFCTIPKSGGSYVEWTFDPAEIAKQNTNEIPKKLVSGRFSREDKGSGIYNWRTRVYVHDFIKDKTKSRINLEYLENQITANFSVVMRKRGVSVSIKVINENGDIQEVLIKASDFTGRPLALYKAGGGDSGDVLFKIYTLDTKSAPKGRILFYERGDPYGMPCADLLSNTRDLLDKEVVEALSCGIFEGEVHASNIKIDAGRRFFVLDDALVDLCLKLNKWYREVGFKYADREVVADREQRLQDLGRRSMEFFSHMVDDPKFLHLKEVLQSFKFGTVGKGHTDKTDISVGRQAFNTLATSSIPSKPKSDGSVGSIYDRGNGEERPGHMPFLSAGPKGSKRIVVKNDSQGLILVYSDMLGEDAPYRLDHRKGEMLVNTRHPYFGIAEKDNSILMRYMEICMIYALTAHTFPEERRDVMNLGFYESLKSMLFWLEKADDLSGRKPGSALANFHKKKKAEKEAKKK